MAWLDAVKGAIFNEDPNTPQAAPAAKGPTITTANITPGQPMMMSSPVNPEFVAAIRKAVLGRNTALTQLMATADKLAAIIPDPGQRLKAAFATAGDGRTVAQIVQAVDVHLSDVDGEEQKFKAALAGKVQAEVAPLEQQAQLMAGQVERAQQEIVAAQTRIAELTGSIGTLTHQAGQAQAAAAAKRQELELMESNFKLAANAVRAELQGNKAAVASALG
jgi:chromosome segregation ATPase